MNSISNLIIELDRLGDSPDCQGVLRDEFEAGGMTTGRFAVGDITAEPSMVYFLWHDSGEVPFSMLARRESFADEAGTRAAARAFLEKWKQRR